MIPLVHQIEHDLAEAKQQRQRLHASFVRTEDGTVIVVDPELGTVSGRTREEVDAEIRRLKSFDGWTVRHGERR